MLIGEALQKPAKDQKRLGEYTTGFDQKSTQMASQQAYNTADYKYRDTHTQWTEKLLSHFFLHWIP